MDLGGHMVPRAEWATFGVPGVWGVGGGNNLMVRMKEKHEGSNNSNMRRPKEKESN